MVTRPERVESLIAASAGLATLALLLLGWQIRKTLEHMHLPESKGHGADAALSHSRSTLVPAKADFRRCHPEGGARWVSKRAVPVRGSDKNVIWNGSLFDIAEFRTA